MTTEEKIEDLRQKIAQAEAELPGAQEATERTTSEWYEADARRLQAMDRLRRLRFDIDRWRGSLRYLERRNR